MIEDVLTLNPVKKAVYQRDSHFIQAMSAILSAWPDTRSVASFLWNHAAILLRPEAILARSSHTIFPSLRAHGLIPVSVRRIHLTAEKAALMWRYQANVMTQGHRVLLQRLLAAGPSIYIVLRDHKKRSSTPAAGHVTYLKGPTLMAKRGPRHLRSLAGPVIANVVSYIHASDDPADFVRELAVLFPSKAFLEILREAAAGQDRTCAALTALKEAERYAPKGVLGSVHDAFQNEEDLSAEDSMIRREWIEIIKCAQRNISYVGGEVYDTRAATIPDDKKYLARLDSHLTFADIGPGF
jgi:hypothetical protein